MDSKLALNIDARNFLTLLHPAAGAVEYRNSGSYLLINGDFINFVIDKAFLLEI